MVAATGIKIPTLYLQFFNNNEVVWHNTKAITRSDSANTKRIKMNRNIVWRKTYSKHSNYKHEDNNNNN